MYRSLLVGVVAAGAFGCRPPAPLLAIRPLVSPLHVELHALGGDQDSVHVAVRARVVNLGVDTLTLETTCGGGLLLQVADHDAWRAVTSGVEVRECAMYTEIRLVPGDSTTLDRSFSAVRGPAPRTSHWVAPLDGRFRLSATASRCIRDSRRACWLTLVSAPFGLQTTK